MVLVKNLGGSTKVVGRFGYLFGDTEHQIKEAFAELIYLNFNIAAMKKASRSKPADHPLADVGRGYGARCAYEYSPPGHSCANKKQNPERYHTVRQNFTLTGSMLIKTNYSDRIRSE